MMRLKLGKEYAAMLVEVFDNYVSELRMEIAATDRKGMRDALKGREASLKSISKTLKTSSDQRRDSRAPVLSAALHERFAPPG